MPKIPFAKTLPSRVRVQGSGKNEYTVHMLGTMPQWCTCPSFVHRAGPAGEFCKHMKARHGRKAIGVTCCRVCRHWFTPEELQDISSQEVEPGFACCESCK